MSPLPQPAVVAQVQVARAEDTLSSLLDRLTKGHDALYAASETSSTPSPSITFTYSQNSDYEALSVISSEPISLATPTSSSSLETSIQGLSSSTAPSSPSIGTPSLSGPSSSTQSAIPDLPPARYGDNSIDSSTNHYSKGLSGGAIAGIIISCLVLVVGVVIFVTRKYFVQKRQQNRITWARWSTARFPPFTFKRDVSEKTDAPHPADIAVAAGDNTGDRVQISPVFDGRRMVSPPSLAVASPSLPPIAHNSQSSNSPSSLSPASASRNMLGTYATVQYTYIPSLPDELSISVGEVIRVMLEYDDGWSLCTNAQGEQGVIPNECLKTSASTAAQPHASQDYVGQGSGVWRMSKHASSLRHESKRSLYHS